MRSFSVGLQEIITFLPTGAGIVSVLKGVFYRDMSIFMGLIYSTYCTVTLKLYFGFVKGIRFSLDFMRDMKFSYLWVTYDACML